MSSSSPSSIPWPSKKAMEEKPYKGFNPSQSLVAQIESYYKGEQDAPCLCVNPGGVHNPTCWWNEPNGDNNGITDDILFQEDGWTLMLRKYDHKRYGLMVPDEYIISHPCPIALWRMGWSCSKERVGFCHGCGGTPPDSLITLYHLHRP